MEEKSQRVNGWFFPQKIKKEKHIVAQRKWKMPKSNTPIVSRVIETLSEFFSVVEALEYTPANPVFYRGHVNANYLMVPSVFRTPNGYEEQLYQEFIRHFPRASAENPPIIQRLLEMQHFAVGTRILDISENPLVALYFACASPEDSKDDSLWGAVVLLQEPDNSGGIPDEIKGISSSTVSVMAATAVLPQRFTLEALRQRYQQDGHVHSLANYTSFIDVVRRSVIVRLPMTNQRIKNQQGAFILVNANYIDSFGKPVSGMTPEEFTKKIIAQNSSNNWGKTKELNLELLQSANTLFGSKFKTFTERDFTFRKVFPYSLDNSIEVFQYDPFDLQRLLYRNEKGEQVVIFIPPTAKKPILRQLEKIGIRESFIYPEMDKICKYISKVVGNQM